MSVSSYTLGGCIVLLLACDAVHAHSNAGAFANAASPGGVQSPESEPRRYAAQVLVDPREITGVVLKVNARVTAIHDLYAGRPVSQGEVLVEFESAELETVQRSYAETFANLEYIEEISVTAEEKLIEGRMNLQWRGLSANDIAVLEETREPVRTLRVTAPRDGYLMEVSVREGQVVNPGSQAGLFSLSGTTLMRIAGVDAVAIDAELPIDLAGRLNPGDTAWLHLSPSAQPLEANVEEVVPLATGSGLRQTVRLRPQAGARLLGLRNGQRLSVSLPDMEENGHAH